GKGKEVDKDLKSGGGGGGLEPSYAYTYSDEEFEIEEEEEDEDDGTERGARTGSSWTSSSSPAPSPKHYQQQQQQYQQYKHQETSLSDSVRESSFEESTTPNPSQSLRVDSDRAPQSLPPAADEEVPLQLHDLYHSNSSPTRSAEGRTRSADTSLAMSAIQQSTISPARTRHVRRSSPTSPHRRVHLDPNAEIHLDAERKGRDPHGQPQPRNDLAETIRMYTEMDLRRKDEAVRGWLEKKRRGSGSGGSGAKKTAGYREEIRNLSASLFSTSAGSGGRSGRSPTRHVHAQCVPPPPPPRATKSAKSDNTGRSGCGHRKLHPNDLLDPERLRELTPDEVSDLLRRHKRNQEAYESWLSLKKQQQPQQKLSSSSITSTTPSTRTVTAKPPPNPQKINQALHQWATQKREEATKKKEREEMERKRVEEEKKRRRKMGEKAFREWAKVDRERRLVEIMMGGGVISEERYEQFM
ncbi:hypothetical protein HK102_008973, partial [Quaeritorhiza haematococci]